MPTEISNPIPTHPSIHPLIAFEHLSLSMEIRNSARRPRQINVDQVRPKQVSTLRNFPNFSKFYKIFQIFQVFQVFQNYPPFPGDFLCTCAFPSFVACSRFGSVFDRGAKFVRSVLFALEALTRVFHRRFYGRRAKVGIMQRGELLQRKLPTCCVKEVESGFYKYTNTNIQKQKHKLQ